MMTTRSNLMQSLKPVVRAFGQAADFTQRDLMAQLHPLSRTEKRGGYVQRSIQCDELGLYTIVRLESDPKSSWVRGYRRALMQAGYRERGRLPDKISMERWLGNRRDLARELRFLDELQRDDGPLDVPRRAPRAHVPRSRRRTARTWRGLFQTILDARLALESCAISFHRMGVLRGDAATVVEVRAVALSDADQKLRVVVLVDLSSTSAIARWGRRSLEARGYERSPYTTSYCATRVFDDAARAVAECKQLFAVLVEAPSLLDSLAR
jgi:hypothetical protein